MKQRLTWLNLTSVYIIWGSTYFAIAIAVESMPSLLSMAVRFLSAGVLLGGLLIIKSGPSALRIPRKEAISASLLGALLLACGIGGVSLAEQYVPSGVVALIISLLPLWIAIYRKISGDHPARLSWFGVAVGFLGAAILLKPGQVHAITEVSTGKLFFWMAVVLVGNMGWAFGTFISPKLQLPKNALVLTTYEMFFGGISLIVVAMIRGEQFSHFAHATRSSWLALLYLVLVGSIVAYSSYLWLVNNAPVSLTATYAYVNPVIAVFLGSMFHHERLSPSIFLGGAIVILGVALVITAESSAKKR